MRCPACRNPVGETDPACRACGFSLEALVPAMGMPPVLHPPLADPDGVLSPAERREVMRTLAVFQRRFPQVSPAVVLLPLSRQVPLPLQAFWYFNRGGLFSAVEKGGNSHGVLLLLDGDSPGRAAAMVGYGLEPFVPDRLLEICLTAASGSLLKAITGAGIAAFLRELERQLQPVADSLHAVFGLVPSGQWKETLHSQPEAGGRGGEPEDLF